MGGLLFALTLAAKRNSGFASIVDVGGIAKSWNDRIDLFRMILPVPGSCLSASASTRQLAG